MSSIDALRRKIDRMIEKLPAPSEHWLDGDEWQVIRAIMTQETALYPNVANVVTHTLTQIESLQPEWYTAEVMIGRALAPFLDVRIAIAEKLDNYEKRAG